MEYKTFDIGNEDGKIVVGWESHKREALRTTELFNALLELRRHYKNQLRHADELLEKANMRIKQLEAELQLAKQPKKPKKK